ncbi:MAG: hypothetical protein ACTSQK_00820 [Candidatus Heimdallarchaeota archaeon]
MLIDVYEVDTEGEEHKLEFNDVKVTHKSLLIVVSHDTRYIYVFKGNDVTIVQKFASARLASQKRLQRGYNIRHVEEWEGIDEVFLPILELLGGMHEDDSAPAEKTASTKSAIDRKTVTSLAKPEVVMFSKKKEKPAEAEPKPAPKELTKEEIAFLTRDMPAKLVKVIKTMVKLEPPEKSECDYILVTPKLYILLGDDKKDMRNGKFRVEELSTLPEGVFPAENYYPRILVAKNKVIGVELWARR